MTDKKQKSMSEIANQLYRKDGARPPPNVKQGKPRSYFSHSSDSRDFDEKRGPKAMAQVEDYAARKAAEKAGAAIQKAKEYGISNAARQLGNARPPYEKPKSYLKKSPR